MASKLVLLIALGTSSLALGQGGPALRSSQEVLTSGKSVKLIADADYRYHFEISPPKIEVAVPENVGFGKYSNPILLSVRAKQYGPSHISKLFILGSAISATGRDYLFAVAYQECKEGYVFDKASSENLEDQLLNDRGEYVFDRLPDRFNKGIEGLVVSDNCRTN